MPSLLGCSPPKFLLLLFLGPSQAFGLFTRVWVSGPHSIFMSAQCPCRLSLIAPHLQSSDKFLLGMLGDIYRAFVLNLMRKETKGVILHGK